MGLYLISKWGVSKEIHSETAKPVENSTARRNATPASLFAENRSCEKPGDAGRTTRMCRLVSGMRARNAAIIGIIHFALAEDVSFCIRSQVTLGYRLRGMAREPPHATIVPWRLPREPALSLSKGGACPGSFERRCGGIPTLSGFQKLPPVGWVPLSLATEGSVQGFFDQFPNPVHIIGQKDHFVSGLMSLEQTQIFLGNSPGFRQKCNDGFIGRPVDGRSSESYLQFITVNGFDRVS